MIFIKINIKRLIITEFNIFLAMCNIVNISIYYNLKDTNNFYSSWLRNNKILFLTTNDKESVREWTILFGLEIVYIYLYCHQ
jgi:hypothetical protein